VENYSQKLFWRVLLGLGLFRGLKGEKGK
jgi:hypothetical protein